MIDYDKEIEKLKGKINYENKQIRAGNILVYWKWSLAKHYRKKDFKVYYETN